MLNNSRLIYRVQDIKLSTGYLITRNVRGHVFSATNCAFKCAVINAVGGSHSDSKKLDTKRYLSSNDLFLIFKKKDLNLHYLQHLHEFAV